MPAFKSMLGSALRGEFREAAGYAFIDQKTVDTLSANKSQLEQKVTSLYNEGTISSEQQDKILSGISNTAFPDTPKLTGDDPVSIFTEGVKSDIGKAINAVAFAIPWQVYVVGLIVVAIWLGPTLMPVAARFLGRK